MVVKHSVTIDPKMRVVWIHKEYDGGRKTRVFWNMASFRPPLNEFLSKGRRYRSTVTYEIQNLPSGKKIRIPKSIKVGTKTYCNTI